MIPLLRLSHSPRMRFPRVSGDDPLSPGLATFRAWFSPRERG